MRGLSAKPEAPQKTGFETITLQQTTILNRGVGGRQYGTSEDIETL
jgi:hypothetical protein